MATHDQIRGSLNKGMPLLAAAALGDLATTSTDTVAVVAITPANAAYVQADQTKVADLVNELRTDYNALRADFLALITALK